MLHPSHQPCKVGPSEDSLQKGGYDSHRDHWPWSSLAGQPTKDISHAKGAGALPECPLFLAAGRALKWGRREGEGEPDFLEWTRASLPGWGAERPWTLSQLRQDLPFSLAPEACSKLAAVLQGLFQLSRG